MIKNREVQLQVSQGSISLHGNFNTLLKARGVVVFVHGSGSSRLSPRNRYVASKLNKAGLSTLLFDLLTVEEEAQDRITAELRYKLSRPQAYSGHGLARQR